MSFSKVCIAFVEPGPCVGSTESLTADSGTLSSPGYAGDESGFYLNNQDCYWTIEPSSVSFVLYVPRFPQTSNA